MGSMCGNSRVCVGPSGGADVELNDVNVKKTRFAT